MSIVTPARSIKARTRRRSAVASAMGALLYLIGYASRCDGQTKGADRERAARHHAALVRLEARAEQAFTNVRVSGFRPVAQLREQPGGVFRNRRPSSRCLYRVRGSHLRADALRPW